MSTITGITLSPNNIIGPTNISAILTVNLSSVSVDKPTITIDPSHIAYLDGSMTSVDNGLTWTGTINRSMGMNKVDNTLTASIGSNSLQILFNVLEEEDLYIGWITTNNTNLYSSYAISKDGKTVVLGQPNNSRIIVYKYYNLSWNSYTITDTTNFGYSLDLSHDGTRVIVGAPGTLEVPNPNYCKTYEINNYSFTFQNTYSPTKYNSYITNRCGIAVAISGNGNIISYVRYEWYNYGGIIDILNWNNTAVIKTIDGATWWPKTGGISTFIEYKKVRLSYDGSTIMLSNSLFNYANSGEQITRCGIIMIYSGTNYNDSLRISGSSYDQQIGTNIYICDYLIYAYTGYNNAIFVNNTNTYTFTLNNIKNISYFGDNNDIISITSGNYSYIYKFNSDNNLWVEDTKYKIYTNTNLALIMSNDKNSIIQINDTSVILNYYANILTRKLSSVYFTDMTLTPSKIIYPDTSSNFQINFTTNDKSLNDISGNLILQTNIGYLDNIRLSNYGFRLEGEIKTNGGYSNNSVLIYNEFTPSKNITFSIEVPQSTYHITNSGKKIIYLPFSQSVEDNQGKIEVYDSSGNIEHTFIENTINSVYVNQEGSLIIIGFPTFIKSYLFEDGSWNEHYNGNNEYISGTNLGELVHLTSNNELMVVNNTNETSYEVDIYKESVARYATYFETDVSSIIYPNNSLNFEIRLTTNDVPLADISDNASNLFSIDPSYIGYIDANSLSLSNYGFSLHGTFTVSGEYNLSGVKLFYEDFSSNPISLYSVLDLSINDFYFDSSFVTYLNHTTNKITLVLNREDITNTDVSNSLILDPSNCGSITNVDISNLDPAIKIITFQPAYNFENANCSLTFDYNQGLLDASQTIYFSVNNYVPQISQITNDNLFNYIDTSGTILLEFDRNLLRDLSLNDLSYNDTKLNLQLEKLSDSSYNILVEPSGEYAETQVITVKDLVGADLSNISLEIDTIIPTFSEITLAPNAFNYEVSGGILDVKFNKTLLDRDQLVLTSSSDISFTFLRQLNNTTSINENPTEVVDLDPPLFNFTYTIEGEDVSENIIKSALQKWDNIIVKHPKDTNPGDTKIHITFSVSEMDAGTLGYAYVDYVYFDDNNNNRIIDYSDNIYTSSGFIALSTSSYNSMISETRTDGNTTLYYVLLHEIGHIVGIGPYFGFNNSPTQYFTEDDGTSKKYYIGTNALEKYRMYMNNPSLVGIPIEDDGGAGTANVHPEEQRITSGNSRHIGDHIHEGLDEELMTGWTESGTIVMPLSAITIGFLEDMGYVVDYSYADEYRGINVDASGNKITSLKMGVTMETILPVFPTYSVVQYEVKTNNYGLKSIQDISFNYRGTHDVSNINIDVNTIIPDVSSIYIENILYSDTSGIVTITFNDHDGNYFYGKDASMNIYLDPSLNGNITLNMELIPDTSNIWKGVITTISGEFFPDAALYLQHSGMDGLIYVDVSATYRLDTDIRGLYITLPDILPQRNETNTQTVTYLTYDHNTNKLETDVSFQFNIDVSNNLEQFPYIDICENFINIVGNINEGDTNLVGDIILDKGIGFIGKFWHGILTISGEVNGYFDICYNETLNPLRDDGVIEIREDKLRVNVNTVLPNISNVIVPSKLSYLNISGEIEIEFDKAILTGDENNIQIEYSLEDTNEYQFLNKYGDNAVSGDDFKYVFNSIPYDANKKIALGIGTYTLTGIDTSLHAMTLKNITSDGFITISGDSNVSENGIQYFYGTNVIITVTGNFGTASYDCYNHEYMGGQNRLVYKDIEVSSLVQNRATNWKYTLYLPQEIDTSLNVTINYRNKTSGPHIIPIYGVVPDVSSVTLSNYEITYENPFIDLEVKYNKVLENRNDIFGLITLNASADLIEISGSVVSYDVLNDVFKGTIKLKDTSLHDGLSLYRFEDNLKVVVESLQSAMFSHIGISGESQVFQVDTLQQIENIELNTHHIYYPDVSNTLTVDFRIPIPSDTNLNNYVTLNEGYIVSQDDFISQNGGKTWTSIVSRTENMNLLDNKFAIDYSYNGLYNVSGEILFNAMENPEQRYMKFEQFGSSFIGIENDEKVGTGMALSYDNQTIAISSIETDNENVNIYRLNDNTWTEIGKILKRANALALSEDGKIIVIGDDQNEFGGFNVGIAYVYGYIQDNSWNLLYTIEPETTVFKGYPSKFGNSVSISNNGNIIALGISNYRFDTNNESRGYVKLYKRNTDNVWNSIVDLSGNQNNMLFGSNVKLSGNGLTLAVGSSGYNSETGKINIYSFNDDYSNVSIKEFVGVISGNYCGENITLTNDGKMISYGLRNSHKIVIQNLENDSSYNFEDIGINFGISTLSNDKSKLFIFREQLISSEYKNYIESFEFYNNTWINLGTKLVLTTRNSNNNVKFITSNDGKQLLYSNDNYNNNDGTNNGIVKTYNNQQSIRRRILNFDLDLSNVLYPDISTNFTINFTTNDVSMEDISNKLSIDPSNMGIIEVIETTNNGFKWVGKFTATELLKNNNNKLIYVDTLQENNVYTDSSFISFDIDRSPLDVSLLEITSSNSVSNHIRYDDVSGAIYLEFTRDQVTINDASFVTVIGENLKVLPINSGTIRDISTNDSGISWTAVFEPSSNLITDCSLIFEYSGNEFELPIYRDYRFTIDTVTPNILSININNITYTSNQSDVVVIFTKNDLNDRPINIYNNITYNLTNVNGDFSDYEINIVTHPDFTNNKVINDTWKTKLSVSGELFCECEVVFHYVNPSGFYDISLSSSINIDTRKRGVETMTIKNVGGNKVISGVNYLFNYLDNSGSFLLDFFTNDLSGTDISSNLSLTDLSLNGVSYTLDNYTVINDRLETNIVINDEQYFSNVKMDFSLNSIDGTTENNILRTGNTETFNIDTRRRQLESISFNEGKKLSYLDPSGILTITFNYDIFETVDVITNKLSYDNSELSLSSPQVSNNIYTCTLTSNREYIGSSNVSINYNETVLVVYIEQDTIIPILDLSNCSISSHFIQYNQRYIDISLTFTNEIEDLTDISNTLVIEGLQDSSYNFSTFVTTNSGKFWTGRLNISVYDISLSDLYIYSNYESGTTHSHPNLKFDVNTIRPYIESINFDKNILTYLEPSCNISITFGGGVDVLNANIDDFINYYDISLGSFIKQSDGKTWKAILDVYKSDIQQYVDLSVNFYDQITDTSIYVFTVLPQVNTIDFGGRTKFIYLDKSATNFSIKFNNNVYDDVNIITKLFQFENFQNAYNISYNSNTTPYTQITGDLIFNYDVNITNAYINYSYETNRFGKKTQDRIITIESIDTRIPNITDGTYISNTNLTYDASRTQLYVYFDASLLDISASSVLDASLVTSFVSDPSINISSFEEINKTLFVATIEAERGIDNYMNNSVTVHYMDNSKTLYFNVDTVLRPYSNICFPSGEKVLTDNGYKNIENIDVEVDTIRGKKIEELTQTRTNEKTLVVIKRGALMKNMPNKNTLITNNHKVLYKGKLIEAYKLVKIVPSVVEYVCYEGETLFNILLEGEKEDKMIVNGMIVETLSPQNNVAKLYKDIRKYGTTSYKKRRMIELYNKHKKN